MKFDHERFWLLSWYEVGILLEQYALECEAEKAKEEGHWARARIHWADFRNANRAKKSKVVNPQDLIKLSFDQDRKAEYHEIDIDALKRKFGSKVKKKNGK